MLWPEGFTVYKENGEPFPTNTESVRYLIDQLESTPTAQLKTVIQKLPFHLGFFGRQTFLHVNEINAALKKNS